jgi:flagellar biosynthesis protein FlhG
VFNHISAQANKLVKLTEKSKVKSKTKIVAITSGKGGVGKSTITANIAYILSKQRLKIVVLDADIGLANLQVIFDLKPKKTIFDYLNGTVAIEDILLETQYFNIHLMAGSSGHEQLSLNNGFVFTRLVEDVISLNEYDFLLIDTGAGIGEYVQNFLELTDNIFAITTTDPSALTDVYALLKMISLKKDKLMLCFNHTLKYDTGEAITKSIVKLAIKNKLNSNFMVEYMGNLSEDRTISSTGRLRKLFFKEFEYEIVSKQLKMIVKKLLMEVR